MAKWVLSVTVFAFLKFTHAQIVEQVFPGIHETIVSDAEFSQFSDLLQVEAEQLPINSLTNVFIPTNSALDRVADLKSMLATSALHRRHFVATHFIQGAMTLGLESISWLPSSRWIRTPRSRWLLARRADFFNPSLNRVYIIDRPILPYWFDYSNVTTSLRQFNVQTSSLLTAEKISETVPLDHTFLAPLDAAFPHAVLQLIEAFPGLAQYLSDHLTFRGILDFSYSLGAIISVSGSAVRLQRTSHGLSFDDSVHATDYMLVQRGLVYLIDKLPSSVISMDFLDAQYRAFPDFRTYFVPLSEGLEGSEFSTYSGNQTAFATHLNRFLGYHTTAIPSFWITSTPVQLPMADRSTVNVLPLNDVLYIRSSSGFPSQTVTRISSTLMVLNRFLTPEWMRRDEILEYVKTAAPHFARCASAIAALGVPEQITVFVPTSLTADSQANKDMDVICRNHYVPYVVDSTNERALRGEIDARSSGAAKAISYSLTTLGVVYQVDRVLLPSPYKASIVPQEAPITQLFDHLLS